MAAFTNTSKSSSPTFSTSTRNVALYTNVSKSVRIFGTLTFDEIGALTFDGRINGKLVGDYTFADIIGTIWANTARN